MHKISHSCHIKLYWCFGLLFVSFTKNFVDYQTMKIWIILTRHDADWAMLRDANQGFRNGKLLIRNQNRNKDLCIIEGYRYTFLWFWNNLSMPEKPFSISAMTPCDHVLVSGPGMIQWSIDKTWFEYDHGVRLISLYSEMMIQMYKSQFDLNWYQLQFVQCR